MRAEERDSVVRFLAERTIPPGTAEPFGLYVFGADDPAAELARHVERTVFFEAFGDTPELLAREYDPYEPTSVLFCVIDHLRKLPVGGGRIIAPAPGGPGFKSLNDLPAVWGEAAEDLARESGLDMPFERTCDIATVAVMPEYRHAASSGLVALSLYHGGLQTAPPCGIDWMVAVLDMSVFEMARSRFHAPFVPFAGVEARAYLGSPASIPTWLRISEWEARLSEEDPSLYELVVEGKGLDAAVKLPDWERATALLREASRPRELVGSTDAAPAATLPVGDGGGLDARSK